MKRIIIEIEEDEVPLRNNHNYNFGNSHDVCANCSNNPANNPYASGFCNCTLPYFNGRGIT